jgi:acyl carrier protein
MKKQNLIKFFSEFWKIDPSNIKDSLCLDDTSLKNQSSVRFYQFIAALESNFNVKIDDINNINTFGDLFKNLSSK